jgi:hypothetical protein
MATTTICGTLLSAAAATALLAGLAPTAAFAQSAVGTAYGKATAGSTVTLTDVETGVTLSTKADGSGQFNFAALPPGSYKVTLSNGKSTTVDVRAGQGAYVSFEDTTTVVVRGARNTNSIDVKSVESSNVYTAAQLSELPVGREISSVALLAPGVSKNASPGFFGNTVSVGGASVAENGYYINGFDVTNIRTFLSYADLPFDAIGQEEVKMGGYGAEFGRSLGGVLSVVTKRGTNTWKFGGSVTYSPAGLQSHSPDVLSRDPADGPDSRYNVNSDFSGFRHANSSSNLTYTEYAGGPLIEDKLFIFAAITGQKYEADSYGRLTSRHTADSTPGGLLKLDWYITPNHHLEYTGIYNRDKTKYTYYDNSDYYSETHDDFNSDTATINGGEVQILNYTGHITDTFTLKGMVGHLFNAYNQSDPEVLDAAAAKCPVTRDYGISTSSFTPLGCYNLNQITIADINSPADGDTRDAVRLDAEWILGQHTLRFGYDSEKFTSTHRGITYSGGFAEYYYTTPAAGRKVNGVNLPGGVLYERHRFYQSASGSYEIDNSAWYLEDSWQFTPRMLAYAGLRSESFTNKTGTGQAFVHADNALAPRLGFSWDVNGDSSLKVFGTAGRYYIPVASNTNIRASGFAGLEDQYYYVSGYDANGLPVGRGAQIGGTLLNGTLTDPDANTVSDNELKPMYQDEYILGAEKKFTPDLTLGTRAVYRQIKNGMDDFCSHEPYIEWAADNGYAATLNDSNVEDLIAPCVVINPGNDVTLQFDANGDGTPESHKIDAKYFRLPKYSRNYAALEFYGKWKGPKWTLNGSYTIAFSRGNSEGYVNSSLGQTDAGLTQDWDNFVFEKGATGWLPNDHRHTFKLYGTYKVTDELAFAGNMSIQSGRPKNCLGFADLSDPNIGYDVGTLSFYSGSAFYCMSSDGTVKLAPRGSAGRNPWIYNFDASVAYTPHWAGKHVTFKADVFNLFDTHGVIATNEYSETGSASAYQYSPNYGLPTQYQTPRSVRFSVLYNF